MKYVPLTQAISQRFFALLRSCIRRSQAGTGEGFRESLGRLHRLPEIAAQKPRKGFADPQFRLPIEWLTPAQRFSGGETPENSKSPSRILIVSGATVVAHLSGGIQDATLGATGPKDDRIVAPLSRFSRHLDPR
jgi:hypothetical protein